MADLIEKLVSKHAKVFDKLRSKLIGEAAKLVLLKVDNDLGYIKHADVMDSWFIDFDRFRGRMTLQLAMNTASVRTLTGGASHIAYQGDIYSFVEGDATPPIGSRPWWEFDLIGPEGSWSG